MSPNKRVLLLDLLWLCLGGAVTYVLSSVDSEIDLVGPWLCVFALLTIVIVFLHLLSTGGPAPEAQPGPEQQINA